MDRIQVLFDRDDRVYRFGELVTGRVVIDARSDVTYREIQISFAWHTHGRGDRDKGGEEGLLLAPGDTVFRKDECREFTFRFQAPMGPVTYHGHQLNVDWYLTATAWRSHSRQLECEEDFILVGGEPTGEVLLGDKKVSLREVAQEWLQGNPGLEGLQRRKATDWERKSSGPGMPSLLVALLVFSILGAVFVPFILPQYSTPLLCGGAAIVFALALLVFNIIRNAYKGKIDITELCVEPDMVYCGDQVNCRVDFMVKQDVYLESVQASVYARERVSITRGTATESHEQEISRKYSTKTFDQKLLGGTPVSFTCSFPIEADAPASFTSAHNSVLWAVDLSVNFRGWPGLSRRFPVSVLPRGYILSV